MADTPYGWCAHRLAGLAAPRQGARTHGRWPRRGRRAAGPCRVGPPAWLV